MSGHDGAHGTVQDLGDLLVREILQIGQDHHHPVVVRKGLQGPLHVVVQNPREELGLRVGGLIGAVPPNDPLEGVLDLGEVDAAGLELALAVVVDEGVLEDLEEPGLQVGAFLELVVVLVGLEEGLLDEILRVLRGSRHAIGRVVERVDERHHLRIEVPRGDVARAGGLCGRGQARFLHGLVVSQDPCLLLWSQRFQRQGE